jgi:Skp family chaperone for outer membrane proteins
MRTLRVVTVSVAMMLTFASTVFAQVPPKPTEPQPPRAPAEPPSTTPVALFPADARFAFIDFQRIASTSVSGKLALRILKEFSDKKLTHIEGQSKQLQTLSSKREAGVLSGAALAQLDRDMLKLQREMQFSQQDAQAEFDQMRNDLDTDLRRKVVPVVADIAKERGLHAVFTADSSLLYMLPALDISDDVIKRVDAQPKK